MGTDLGTGYKYKNIKIKYPNGDIYEGMGASYYSSDYEPYGVGNYYQKASGVTFKADWDYRRGPDFKTIEIIDKPEGESFVIVLAKASEIYMDLEHLDIIKANVGTYSFKDLPSIIVEPHAWARHLFTIKNVSDNELVFDFTGPKVDHGKFIDKVVKKGEPQKFTNTIATTIIWDHGDEYDASQSASIEVLYF